MKSKNRLLIVVFALLLIVITAAIYVLYEPVGKLISLYNSNKEAITLGFKAVEIEKEIAKTIEKQVQSGIDVQHYLISIELFPEKKIIRGDVTVSIKMNNPNEEKIELNFYDNLKINSVFLNSKKAEYSRDDNRITIENNGADTELWEIRIVYEGTPKNLGFGSFTFAKVNKKNYVYTMNEPVYASTWYPCVDIPTDKALADIFITNDSAMVSLSNGKLQGVSTSGSKRTYHWKTFYPISTYLVTIYSADYKSYNQRFVSSSKDTVDLFCYATPEKMDDLKRDFSDHTNYLKIFEELFGPYPFPKEKYALAEFWWEYGAMENQTITGIGSKYITGRKFFADMIIHELSHHWWGNAVSPKSWKDIWLNEGFATYSEALYWEKRSGLSALQSTLAPKFDTFDNGTLYNPEINLFSKLVYNKGAWVLHMLRKELGDEVFFKILRSFFERNKYGNADTKDFQNLCESISGKKLTYFFNQWIYKGTGIIDCEYEFTNEKISDGYMLNLEIKQLQNGYDIYKFPVEIKILFENITEPLTIQRYISEKEIALKIPVKDKVKEIIFDPESWLLAKFTNSKN